MSASALWVYFPFCLGIFLLFFAEKKRFVGVVAIIVCIVLSAIALLIPVNSMIVFGKSSIIFTADSDFFGRTMSLSRSIQPTLAFFYFFAAIWFIGTFFVSTNQIFIPVILINISLLIGEMAIKPFIYGAIFVFLSVLLTIPLLWMQRKGEGRGIFLFLLYQMLGLVFLSIGGWLSESVDLNPEDSFLLVRTVILLFLGFTFWLAIFPFYTWIAMLMDETCPYIGGFIISLLQFSSLSILMNYFSSYLWLRTFPSVFEGLRIVGVLMLLLSSFWAVFQQKIQRVIAYVIVAENGISLLLIGMQSEASFSVFISNLFIQILGLLVWSLAIKQIEPESDLTFESLKGLFWSKPMTALALLTAYFSLTGLPLFPGFSLRLSFISICFEYGTFYGWTSALGCWILILTGGKILYYLLFREQKQFTKENKTQRVLMGSSILILLVLGFFPDVFNVFVTGLRSQYSIIVGG